MKCGQCKLCTHLVRFVHFESYFLDGVADFVYEPEHPRATEGRRIGRLGQISVTLQEVPEIWVHPQ